MRHHCDLESQFVVQGWVYLSALVRDRLELDACIVLLFCCYAHIILLVGYD